MPHFQPMQKRLDGLQLTPNAAVSEEAKVSKGALPKGYAFVPKGNVYITSNCRKSTQEAGRSVFVVVDAKKQPIGIGVPADVYLGVQFKEQDTRADRAANVVKRDEGIAKAFQNDIMKEFPQIPPNSLRNVLKIALEKGKGKVGRTGKLDVRRKVQLAVRAHIRHCETDYDRLLRNGIAREEARKQVEAKIQDVFKAWGGGSQARRGKVAAKTPKSPTRLSKKILPAKKRVEQEKPKQAVENTETPRLTPADSVDAILRAAETASPAVGNVFARHAMRALRQKAVVKGVTPAKKKPMKDYDPSLYTSSAKVVPTAASFRSRRTPKPSVIQPVECSPPRAKATQPKQVTRKTSPPLGEKQRAIIKRHVAVIDSLEHILLTRPKPRRLEKRLRVIESSHDRINTALANAGLEKIENSAAARKDLVRRLGLAVGTAQGS